MPAVTTRTAAVRSPRVRAAARRKAVVRRRRLFLLAGVAAASLLAFLAIAPVFHTAVKEITLPLRHEDIIRQQARDKGIDPALIAGVIYAESRFRDGQVSHAGARGLMQLTPATADDIARWSGGTQFTTEDLATPQVNIAYGAYYLRHMLDRYDGNQTLALAAYNAGAGNVDRWLSKSGGSFRLQDIPFPETRHYVQSVEQARRDYRAHYARELGL